MSLLPGALLLLFGLLAMLAAVHFKALRYFDRPALARNAFFDPALGVVKWALLLAGLGLLGRASPAAGAVALVLLLLAWGYRRLIGSAFVRERLLRREFEALRARRPGLTDEEILFEIASRRHPRWGPELIEQMVREHPSVESLAGILTRMERGFRAFSGRRPRSR